MKYKKFLKENLIVLISSIIIFAFLILNEKKLNYTYYPIIHYLISFFPFTLIVLLIIYGQILSSIDENIWEEFKKGRDFHIDKMMRNLKTVSILIIFLSFIYVVIQSFAFYYFIQKNNLYKFIFLILIPSIISICILINYCKMRKEYNDT